VHPSSSPFFAQINQIKSNQIKSNLRLHSKKFALCEAWCANSMIAEAKNSSQGSQGAAQTAPNSVPSPEDADKARQVAELLQQQQQLELEFKQKQVQVQSWIVLMTMCGAPDGAPALMQHLTLRLLLGRLLNLSRPCKATTTTERFWGTV
jgi:hypothetical protein